MQNGTCSASPEESYTFCGGYTGLWKQKDNGTHEKLVLAGISMLGGGHTGVFCMLKRYACNF